MPNLGLRLKEPAIAGYTYNPPQTPPFEKEGLVVSLRLTSPKVSLLCIYLGALFKSPFFVTAYNKFCANRKIERPKIFS